MPFLRTTLVALMLFAFSHAVRADQAEPVSHPKVLDERLKIELFVEHPDLATPTGIDVDHLGRVWVIESNTHFPPEGYNRHLSDRILVMHDKNNDGRATRDEITMFADDLKFTMSVVVRPVWLEASGERKLPVPSSLTKKKENEEKTGSLRPPLALFVAMRNEILLLTDTDGDLKCDARERIVHLETKGNYPHNGLAGIAFDALGWMYFGFGENLGADYKIIGSDGVTLSGGGEGGNMYRCQPDGSQLKQWATGFWNPHASCVDAFGRLFTVDNDADSRPPCRLLHIIPDGDYGYRFRLGRKGLHPFTSWNGEIPGTLPMVAGTGEAPSGILAYESDGLPEDYIGNLIVTSWGDHRIDRYRLKPKGASFESIAEPIVQGDENFRPVGIACAPDGSLYFSDWVLRDYKLHGKGRVWRVSAKEEREEEVIHVATIDAKTPMEQLNELLESPRLDVRRTAAKALSTTPEGRERLTRTYLQTSLRASLEVIYAIALVPRDIEMDAFDLTVVNSMNSADPHSTMPELIEPYSSVLVSDTPQLSSMNDTALVSVPAIALFFGSSGELADTSEELLPHYRLASVYLFRVIGSRLIESILYVLSDEEIQTPDQASFWKAIENADPFLYREMIDGMSQSYVLKWATARHFMRGVEFPRARLAFYLSTRRRDPRDQEPLKAALSDPSPLVRRAAVQWVAEEHLVGFRPQVENLLHDPTITADLFLATLAALEMLDGVPPQEFDSTPPGKYVLPIVQDDARPAAVRALALKLVPPTDPALDGELLANLLTTEDPALKRETIRTLNASPVPQAAELLRSLVKDDQQPLADRIDATVGLAASATALDQPSLETLADLTYGSPAQYGTDLYIEALRSLRGVAANDATLDLMLSRLAPLDVPTTSEELDLAEQLQFSLLGSKYGMEPAVTQAIAERRPQDENEWLAEIAKGGDAERGRRVFFHAHSAGCFKCHTYDGRGGKIGPDLTNFGRNVTAEKIIASLLTPSQEVAPQFTTWTMVDKDGRVHTGMIVHENEGKTVLGDAEGKLMELETIDVVERTPQKVSVMPEKLIDRLTVQEVRDLVAFLRNAAE
ncbi:MAG: PVC-type heme-binding CxxCH protein [Planctomycetaceae bacterium]